MDLSNKKDGLVWKQQVQDHFSEVSLSLSETDRLEKLLLDGVVLTEPRPAVAKGRSSNMFLFAFEKFQKFGGSYLLTAVAAASLTLYVAKPPEEQAESLFELASSPIRTLPPDFDLEGDPDFFPEVLEGVYPKDAFASSIPSEVRSRFAPNEGRFFSWAGVPGVIINLVDKKSLRVASVNGTNEQTTLYIVKLAGSAERKFPAKKFVKQVRSASGREKRIAAWREGKYGYALVSNVSIESEDN